MFKDSNTTQRLKHPLATNDATKKRRRQRSAAVVDILIELGPSPSPKRSAAIGIHRANLSANSWPTSCSCGSGGKRDTNMCF